MTGSSRAESRSPSHIGPVLDRASLAARTRRVLNPGGWGNPDVLLVESDSGPVVVKDFSARPRWVRGGFGRWLLRREERAYRRLEHLAAVPRLLGRIDHEAIVIEYRPGTLLSRSLAGRLPASFLSELEAAIAGMHACGVVHLDLRHRSNILASDQGRPVVIDFASACCFTPESWFGRVAVRWLGAIDWKAFEKWRVRLED